MSVEEGQYGSTLEVGHGSDAKYEELLSRFGKQIVSNTNTHQLVDTFGYEVHLRPLPLGVAGTVYKTNLTTLVDVGLIRHK